MMRDPIPGVMIEIPVVIGLGTVTDLGTVTTTTRAGNERGIESANVKMRLDVLRVLRELVHHQPRS